MAYQINFSKLKEMGDELEPQDFAMLIVIAEFNRPVEEEEVFAKIEEYGLDKMSVEEIIEWIEDWKNKNKYVFN